MIKKINTIDEFNNTIKEGLWLVDFSAKWCGPCRMLEPVIENIKEDYNVIQIDIDEALELAAEYGIMSVPTLIVFKNGTITSKEIGYRNEEDIKSMLSK